MSSRFVVEGGIPLRGEIDPAGNKNEALPAIAAALLCEKVVTLRNLPCILDVRTMVELVREMGVRVDWDEKGPASIDSCPLDDSEPEPRLAQRIRGSFLLAPALLHRRGHVCLPRPGGDRIGRRRIDTHLKALELLGATVKVGEDSYELRLDGGFRGSEVFLDEASVMATENAVMAASVAEGITQVMNAASEPHVQGLCRMLIGMGARIEGVGSNVLEIEGTPDLQGVDHRIAPDHIEVGSFLAAAAVTRGRLLIRDIRPADLRMIRMAYSRLGIRTEIVEEGSGTEARVHLLVPDDQELRVKDDVHGAIPKIDDAPWPGFPADLSSIALVAATQSTGVVLIHEKLFESRLFFVDRLIAMGAKVVLCDPHRAVVIGPSKLHGATMASPDIRAGMALLAAALCAEGRSVIMNAHQVDRGYVRIDERLRSLGARITREE